MPNAKLLAIAEMLIISSEQIHSMSHKEGLTAAQWSALRYFASANARAANLASFVKHHGTTKGTASRTISRLVEKGMLTRKQDPTDKRRLVVHVPAKGRKLLAKDPALTLANAIDESDIKDLDVFAQAVFALLKSPGLEVPNVRMETSVQKSAIALPK